MSSNVLCYDIAASLCHLWGVFKSLEDRSSETQSPGCVLGVDPWNSENL